VTSRVPRWLEVRDGKIHVLEDRAQLVRRIFDMYVNGFGRGVIANALIKEGIPAWNTRKPAWHRSYIEKLPCNRAVVGGYIAEFKTDEGGEGERRFRSGSGVLTVTRKQGGGLTQKTIPSTSPATA